jgi:hypothetical protein
MTLQLLHSEFPYKRGKFDFLFISVASNVFYFFTPLFPSETCLRHSCVFQQNYLRIKTADDFSFRLIFYISFRFLDTRAHQVQEEGSRGTEGSSTRKNCPRACPVSKYRLLLCLYCK